MPCEKLEMECSLMVKRGTSSSMYCMQINVPLDCGEVSSFSRVMSFECRYDAMPMIGAHVLIKLCNDILEMLVITRVDRPRGGRPGDNTFLTSICSHRYLLLHSFYFMSIES